MPAAARVNLPQQAADVPLPAEGRGACAEMIEHWGTVAEGTATWSVRALFRWEQASGRTLLVAFRCGSSYADYASYYDERLGIVSLEPSSARLRLIPAAAGRGNRPA